MTCPRCGNEWDVSKSPCGQCGLLVRMPANFRGSSRSAEQPPKKTSSSGVMPSVNPSRQFPGSSSASSPNMQRTPTTPKPSSSERNGQGGAVPSTPPPGLGQNQRTPLRTATSQQGNGVARPASVSNPSHPPLSALPRSVRPTNGTSSPANIRPFQSAGMQYQAAVRDGATNTGGFSLKQVPPTSPPSMRTTEQLNPSSVPYSRPLTPEPVQNKPEEMAQGTRGATVREMRMGGQPVLAEEQRMLIPGTMLRGGRYRLQELLRVQEWQNSMYEAMWVAQDGQRGGASAMVCEVVVSDITSMKVQSMLRAATIALTSAGRRARIPAMRDVFSDQGRSFFVFEPVSGESLLGHMQRTGRAIPEQQVIDCCLQMLDALDALAQQNPPLVHGLIRPEHIIESSQNKEYILTNFSIILAGDASLVATNIEQAHLSAYTSPEFAHGMIDGRADLYALLATAYHVATGSLPTPIAGAIPAAQRLNPGLSSRFAALLEKGLHPSINQRYQRVAELRQDLLAIRSISGTLTNAGVTNTPLPPMRRQDMPTTPRQSAVANDSVSQLLPNIMASALIDDNEREEIAAPAIENLPPLVERNDTLAAALWVGGILLCLLVLVIVSRGFI